MPTDPYGNEIAGAVIPNAVCQTPAISVTTDCDGSVFIVDDHGYTTTIPAPVQPTLTYDHLYDQFIYEDGQGNKTSCLSKNPVIPQVIRMMRERRR